MQEMEKIDPFWLAQTLREQLQEGKTAVLTVVSRSMLPLLQPGDEVVLTAVAPDQLQPGDIITYLAGQHLMTHRFWEERAGRLRTRGDRPVQFDPPFLPEQLVGRVQARRRNGRELTLATGVGAWLNERLAKLVQQEWLWLVRLGVVSVSAPEQAVNPRLRSWPIRWRRRLVLAWAFLLCALADGFSRLAKSSFLRA